MQRFTALLEQLNGALAEARAALQAELLACARELHDLALNSNPPDVAAVDGFRQSYLKLFSQPSSLGAACEQSKAETALD